VGTKTAPRFRVAPGPLEAPWGFVPHAGFSASMADVDHDGRIDALEGTSVTEIRGSPYSPEFLRKGTVTSGGAPISHPGPGYGDLEYYTVLHDWDGDGRYDLLWGTQQGNIWLHRASAAGGPMSFEPGIELRLTSGQDLKVGPPVVDPRQVKDFTVLQGARIKFTVADFDRDGIDDLAVIDTYRDLTIFRNTRKAGTDTLAPGVKVGKLHHVDDAGGTISAFDWDRDGRPDIVTGGTSEKHGETFMNRSRPGHPEFSEPVYPIALPYVFWGPKFMAVDWNGDGDEDLLIQSEFYSMWAERSFLERGYSRATQVRVERRR
jgi:hypothetical protein